jgi:hypothetical protein
MTPLCEISTHYDTDKGPTGQNATLGVFPGHNYTPTYHDLFGPIRGAVTSLCEVGVWSGGSMHLWADYFPNAALHAVDIDFNRLDDWMRNGPVRLHHCSQTDVAGLLDVARLAGDFDITVDDASHQPDDMTVTLAALWRHTRRWYVIEDIRREHLARYRPHWNDIAGGEAVTIQSALSPDVVALAWRR